MLVARYRTKKDLKAAVGQELRYEETSMFGEEYKPDGAFAVVGPGAYQRKWYAQVTMQGGRIARVR
jgi:hypothetical protein